MVFPGPDPKILDDLARVAGGAVNIFSGLQEQLRQDMRSRMEEMMERLDLVPRDDLDRALGMIEKLRKDVSALEARIDALDGKAPKKTATKKTPAKKTATKKKTTKKK
jgi:BMFP domain-containing protein YqiC